jgi:CTP:molybdopterin cytidylyltransferase MocA
MDPDGLVAGALAGSPAILAEPAPLEQGPVGQMVRGMAVAANAVRETEAALIWPGRMAWVGPETVTSLVEAYGARRGSVLRPVYEGEAGWPVVVPAERADLLGSLGADLMPDALMEHLIANAGSAFELIDLGDPGTTHDISTPLDSLPEYSGPPEPVAGHAPEWGSAAADMPDDSPLEGPALAPYSQAAEEGD